LAAEAASLAEGGNLSAAKRTDEAPAHAVNAKKNRQLYAARKKIYPKRVKGTFRKAKWIVMALTLSIYYFTPWIRWHREGDIPDQAVLIDFQARLVPGDQRSWPGMVRIFLSPDGLDRPLHSHRKMG
jgi:hypothetical protein